MNKVEQITRYIKEIFEAYTIDYQLFDYELDYEETEEDDTNIEDVQLNMPIIEEIAMNLGCDAKDLIDMNDSVTMKWFRKYSYFGDKTAFDNILKWSFKDDEDGMLRLIDAIFGSNSLQTAEPKFDKMEVFIRLIEHLKELDNTFPGTFHKNATINNLFVQTDYFFHLEEATRMINSYLTMIKRAEELFFKAWDVELEKDEIHEYNIIVTAIGLQDINYYSTKYVYYNLLKKFIPIYKSEGYKSFWSFVKIANNRKIEPWRCADFISDENLVQSFVNTFPEAKAKMRDFSMSVSHYDCSFSWSDAKPMYSLEETQELDSYFSEIGVLDIFEDLGTPTEENLAKEITEIYLPKNELELNVDKKYIEQLRKLSGSKNLGGVSLPEREYIPITEIVNMSRMQARAAANNTGTGGFLYE